MASQHILSQTKTKPQTHMWIKLYHDTEYNW